MSLAFPKSKDLNLTKNLVKNHKLVQHLDRYLGEEIESFEFIYEPKKKDSAWHPSGDCLPTPSSLYDKALGSEPKEKFSVSLMKTFMVGHFWHQLLQKAILDIGFADESSIERQGTKVWGNDIPEIFVDLSSGISETRPVPKPFHWATGAGDVAPCAIPNFGDCIVDFKTMSSHQFKQKAIPEWAANKYEAQINIYMDFFDQEQGMILSINKDGPHDMKEFHYERNQPLIDAIYEKWHFVSECIDMGIRPTEEFDVEFDVGRLCKGPRV